MLKRRGAHFRPVPERRCRSRLTLEAAGGETGSGAAGGSSARLQPSAASFPTGAPPRETAALQHFARAGYHAHQTCQLCQEAIRARLSTMYGLHVTVAVAVYYKYTEYRIHL